jgi:hypothetical protein
MRDGRCLALRRQPNHLAILHVRRHEQKIDIFARVQSVKEFFYAPFQTLLWAPVSPP